MSQVPPTSPACLSENKIFKTDQAISLGPEILQFKPRRGEPYPISHTLLPLSFLLFYYVKILNIIS